MYDLKFWLKFIFLIVLPISYLIIVGIYGETHKSPSQLAREAYIDQHAKDMAYQWLDAQEDERKKWAIEHEIEVMRHPEGYQ